MQPALCLHGKEVAEDLYRLIQFLTPQGQLDIEARARAELERIRHRLERTLAEHRDLDLDRRLAAVRKRMGELARVIEEKAPRATVSRESLLREWQSFRRRASPAYEALAASLRPFTISLPSLRPKNYARSLMHVSSGIIAVLLIQYILTPMSMLAIAFSWTLFAWTMELGRRHSQVWNRILMTFFNPVAHPHEHHRVNSSTWYCTALLTIALIGSPLACSLGLIVLGVSDPMAALIGRRYGRIRIRAGRSLEGTSAFVISGMLSSWLVLALFYPGLGYRAPLTALVAALAGAAAEVFSTRIDDNLSIPVATAAAAMAMTWLLGLPV